jgi:TIR domain
MGIRVSTPAQAVAAIEDAVGTKHFICIFLIEDRPSHRDMIRELNEQFSWIDSLSYQSDVLTLILDRIYEEIVNAPSWASMEMMLLASEEAHLEVLDRIEVRQNPSPLLAKEFEIPAQLLPGVLCFRASQSANDEMQGIYLPIDPTTWDSENYLEKLYETLRMFSRNRTVNELSTTVFTNVPNGQHAQLTKRTTLRNLKNLAKRALTMSPVTTEPLKNANYMPVAERKNAKIFISYSTPDRLSAQALAESLREVGFAPWIDVVNLIPGEQWEHAINDALHECDFFIACLSKQSVTKRGYIQREFKRALELWEEKLESDIFLLPLRLDDCEVPREMRRFQWLDWQDGAGLRKLVAALTEGMRRLGKYTS